MEVVRLYRLRDTGCVVYGFSAAVYILDELATELSSVLFVLYWLVERLYRLRGFCCCYI